MGREWKRVKGENKFRKLKTGELYNAVTKHVIKLLPSIILEAEHIHAELVALGENILKK